MVTSETAEGYGDAERGDGERGYLVSVTRGERRLDGIGEGRCNAEIGGNVEVVGKKDVRTVGEGDALGESTCMAWNVDCTSRSISTSESRWTGTEEVVADVGESENDVALG